MSPQIDPNSTILGLCRRAKGWGKQFHSWHLAGGILKVTFTKTEKNWRKTSKYSNMSNGLLTNVSYLLYPLKKVRWLDKIFWQLNSNRNIFQWLPVLPKRKWSTHELLLTASLLPTWSPRKAFSAIVGRLLMKTCWANSGINMLILIDINVNINVSRY